MLTQFGKTWIDTEKVCSVKEQEWRDTTLELRGTKFQIWIGTAYDEISDIADPEGFKAFKEWLEQQKKGHEEYIHYLNTGEYPPKKKQELPKTGCPAHIVAGYVRYQWLKNNPAWETECVLSSLSPDEFEKLLIDRMMEDRCSSLVSEYQKFNQEIIESSEKVKP